MRGFIRKVLCFYMLTIYSFGQPSFPAPGETAAGIRPISTQAGDSPSLIPVPAIIPVPKISVELMDSTDPDDISSGLKIMVLLTILSLAPSIMIMMTSFTRIVIVLSFVRRAIATQSLPSNQIIVSLAILLTIYVMTPVWKSTYEDALVPYFDKKISQEEAIEKGLFPIREFMFHQTYEKDLELFVKLARNLKPQKKDEVPTHVLIPAFITSELKTSFQMGILIFVPFLVVDIVVASVLMSMGMIMLPPVMISMPFKLLLFVMADGWTLIIKSVVTSFKI